MPDNLATLTTALADRYRIERELGQGGMATVYLAEDLKHHRKVAIKVLRPELAAVIGAERFVHEIQTIAALQHPHILGLIDSGEVNGTAYYVMPFIEGESLRDRLTREKQLPINDAVRFATEVASALDYAHRHGVIHRDIKPENILLHDGQALVADFGIALAVSHAGGSRMTETGMSLGTPTYMSPEQAMGEREITARSDVYALGCVTYEMLLGEPPFTGPTAQAIVARVMTEEPRSLALQRKSIPEPVEVAVLTALEKLPADRFPSAAEFAAALAGGGQTVRRTVGRSSIRPASDRPSVPVLLVALVATAAVALWGWLRTPSHAPPSPVTRLAIAMPNGEGRNYQVVSPDIAVSPDGRSFVYSVGGEAGSLWLRRLDQLHATPIPGTDAGSYNPFFSPDGRSIAFSAGTTRGELKVIALSGGPPTTLVPDSAATWGGAWGEDGFIYFAAVKDLRRIPATGGSIEILVRPDSATGERQLYQPEPLPNGRGVLFAVDGKSGMQIRAKRLPDGPVTGLGPGISARYLFGGYLAIAQRDGKINVARFDQDKLTLTSPSVPVLDQVQVLPFNNGPVFAVSRNGTVVYGDFGAAQIGTPTWVSRSGIPSPVEAGWNGVYDNPALSPDGTRIALTTESVGNRDIWTKRIGGPLSRLTLGETGGFRPEWSPDGRAVLFAVEGGDLMLQPADGSAPARLLLRSGRPILEGQFSRDGQWLVYRIGGGGGDSRDIYARRLTGDSAPLPLLTSSADEYDAALSPDGRWLAYVSDESGTAEVYVRPFPSVTAAKWQISNGGGTEPVWAHSGRELFFRDKPGKMVSAAVGATGGFSVGIKRTLFDATPYRAEGIHPDYALSPDDQRFLMIRRDVAGSSSLIVVLNWLSEVQQRLAGKQ